MLDPMMTTDSPSDPVDPAPTAQADDGGGGPLEPVPYDPALDELAGLPAEQVLEKKQSRAGRNLPAAIGVGVGLGVLIVATLLIRKESFLVARRARRGRRHLGAAGALRNAGVEAPLVPPVVGLVACSGPPTSTARPAWSWPGP